MADRELTREDFMRIMNEQWDTNLGRLKREFAKEASPQRWGKVVLEMEAAREAAARPTPTPAPTPKPQAPQSRRMKRLLRKSADQLRALRLKAQMTEDKGRQEFLDALKGPVPTPTPQQAGF